MIGVLSIIGQHQYLVFYSWSLLVTIIGVKYLSYNFGALIGVLVNMTEPVWWTGN